MEVNRWELLQADVIVHSGDFTMAGTEEEAIGFLEWFLDLPTLTRSLLPEIMTIA